jgi:hypothetical protein
MAGAQTTPITPMYSPPPAPESGPLAIPLGDTGIGIAPFLTLSGGHDDNVGLSHTNQVESYFWIFSPGFVLDARTRNSIARLSYQAAVGHYTGSPNDNYVDQTARGSWDLAFSARSALRLGYDYVLGHDPRGATDRPQANRPDKYVLETASGLYAYGAPGAQGRFEVYGSDARKHYTNNRDFTFLADRENIEYGAAFYWRVMPRTHALFEARRTEIDYKSPQSLFSGVEERLYVGATWEATAATSGTVKVGELRKHFDSGFPMFKGTSWEGLVSWSPRTYSRFDIYSSRQPTESTGLGRFILSEASGVNWTHSWSSILSTGVKGRYQKDEYEGFDREDKIKSIGANVGYKFRRWMTLGAEYTYTKRDSNISNFEYDRNLFMVTAAFTL